MTLDDLEKSPNLTKMSLWFEGFFVISPPFFCGESAVCKTPRRAHFYEVKYSALYFTWKLYRNCAKLPVKMLLIKTSNRLCRLVCLSVIERQVLRREIYELHGCKNAEDESWQFGRSF